MPRNFHVRVSKLKDQLYALSDNFTLLLFINKKVQLKEIIQDLNGGLDYEVQKSGSNLSVGTKQLMCLARAILKRSKILVIDEATANVDFKLVSIFLKSTWMKH
jgi:ABC-type transport system involved in cytochrome bd biosynthesis fused ATPase/permease subunit